MPEWNDYFKPLIEMVEKHPELKATPEYLEMTREEQMKWHWQRINKTL